MTHSVSDPGADTGPWWQLRVTPFMQTVVVLTDTITTLCVKLYQASWMDDIRLSTTACACSTRVPAVRECLHYCWQHSTQFLEFPARRKIISKQVLVQSAEKDVQAQPQKQPQ